MNMSTDNDNCWTIDEENKIKSFCWIYLSSECSYGSNIGSNTVKIYGRGISLIVYATIIYRFINQWIF